MLNLVLFGPPGAGKGTQARFLADHFNLTHLSTGDLFRQEISAGTELGKAAEELISKGNLVPDQIVISMIESQIENRKNSSGFIFDGFPRTVPQAEALDELLAKYNSEVAMMLCLEVEKGELVKRLLLRGETSGRADDLDIDTIDNRYTVYIEKTAPIINYYAAQGKYRPVFGVGSIDDIADTLRKAVLSVQ